MAINSRTETLSYTVSTWPLNMWGGVRDANPSHSGKSVHLLLTLPKLTTHSVCGGLAPGPQGHQNVVLQSPGWGDADPPTKSASAPVGTYHRLTTAQAFIEKRTAETRTSAVQTCVVPESPETCNTMAKSQNITLKENLWKSTCCVSMTF